jgi:hypothetical protein
MQVTAYADESRTALLLVLVIPFSLLRRFNDSNTNSAGSVIATTAMMIAGINHRSVRASATLRPIAKKNALPTPQAAEERSSSPLCDDRYRAEKDDTTARYTGEKSPANRSICPKDLR